MGAPFKLKAPLHNSSVHNLINGGGGGGGGAAGARDVDAGGAVGWRPVAAKARAPWRSSCLNAPAGERLQRTIARPSAHSESTAAWRGHAEGGGGRGDHAVVTTGMP